VGATAESLEEQRRDCAEQRGRTLRTGGRRQEAGAGIIGQLSFDVSHLSFGCNPPVESEAWVLALWK
jgi:hypothetical protein